MVYTVNKQIERRNFEVEELRVEGEGDGPKTIVGYAAVFNKLSEPIMGIFRERIKPGAFTKSLSRPDDIRALIDHDPSKIIGRNKSGTLELTEDKRGLKVKITPPDTTAGRDIMISIERGDVTGMSFGFRTISDRWETKNKEDIRTLEDVELFDVSPVTYPAYPDTTVAVRSHEMYQKQKGQSSHMMHMRLRLAEIAI